MYLKSIRIENYRLLRDVTVSLDRSLTLFVGKNNTGKTSIMQAIELLLSGTTILQFDDYPLDCRQKLYSAVLNYWRSTSEDSLLDFQKSVPLTKVIFTIDYSDNIVGNVSEFIIDLDESIEETVIQVSFEISSDVSDILAECKEQFVSLVGMDAIDHIDKNEVLQSVVKRNFSRFFTMKITAVNPASPDDFLEKKKTDLQNLFYLKVIKAERNMGESEVVNSNPLGKIMKTIFSGEFNDIEKGIQEYVQSIQKLINDSNFYLQGQINTHMAEIVKSMLPFGYPAADDLQLHASTNIDLERSICEETELMYVSLDASESLPSSHNGLGYKNLIKISLELHDFSRMLKNDRTRLPLLFLEEPEAHMHPQLQTTFISFVEDFLRREIGDDVVQVIMTTHSAHIANTVEFNKVRYIKRYTNQVVCKPVSEFPQTGTLAEQKSHLDFLQKYMKLSYCDLYFCDKAILVEGASERLLIPDMIRKCKDSGWFTDSKIPMSSQYYSIIEVGGAYAHHFYDFVDYLEIPTLIITDIDFVKGEHGQKCQRNEAERSSNGAINRWCHKKLGVADNTIVQIDQIINMTDVQRTDGYRHIEFQKEENSFHPRSLEDAVMNCNRDLFRISEGENPDFYSSNEKKTDFALKLLMENSFKEYNIPSYIRDGLVWLNGQSRTGGQWNG